MILPPEFLISIYYFCSVSCSLLYRVDNEIKLFLIDLVLLFLSGGYFLREA